MDGDQHKAWASYACCGAGSRGGGLDGRECRSHYFVYVFHWRRLSRGRGLYLWLTIWKHHFYYWFPAWVDRLYSSGTGWDWQHCGGDAGRNIDWGDRVP